MFLHCIVGGRDLAPVYDGSALDAADRLRIGKNPAVEQRADWQVSRVLKQCSALPVRSLSHSKAWAAVLASEGDMPCGVDIEMMRSRDFAALADWVADAAERAYLAGRAWAEADFYRLWCCKEALLKACGLSFPADMQKVGWHLDDGGLIALRAPGAGWHGMTVPYGGLMLAAVWQGDADCRFVLQTADGVRDLPLAQAVFY